VTQVLSPRLVTVGREERRLDGLTFRDLRQPGRNAVGYTACVQFFRQLRRRIALMASILMLAVALVPSVSRAMVTASGHGWAEICTTQGTKWVSVEQAVAGESTDDAAVFGGHLDHCPLCSLGAHSPALLGEPVVLGLFDAPDASFPERFFSASRTPHAWCTAQPRAPPAHS
jgi:Protein of unknown function (DUF2946)